LFLFLQVFDLRKLVIEKRGCRCVTEISDPNFWSLFLFECFDLRKRNSINIFSILSSRISALTDYVLAEPGDTAVFECAFTANPVVYDNIRWFGPRSANLLADDDNNKDDADDEEEEEEVLGDDGSGRIVTEWEEVGEGGVRARLRMRNVTRRDAGRIFCAIGNGIGEPVRRPTFLLVKGRHIILLARLPGFLTFERYPTGLIIRSFTTGAEIN
jgi:hypothetical protein